MPRFAAMLTEGMRDRGHSVEVWSPKSGFFNFPSPEKLKKWLGYIDQYIIFPDQVRKKLTQCAKDTLFVFADQALGPWVPLVADRPHVIHCHDFLAQKSANGIFKENVVGWTGMVYQKYIRQGYLKGKNFISVSEKTRADLHEFYTAGYWRSEVVYNGLSAKFLRRNVVEARESFSMETGVDVRNGYLLHVGGNQWYKNRTGVVEIYNAWRTQYGTVLPLMLIGTSPSGSLTQSCQRSPYKKDIHILPGMDDEGVKNGYAGASIFLFPSLAEGFGWPIAEAMASGTPVITTNEAPMTEVAGHAAFFINRRPIGDEPASKWAVDAAGRIQEILNLTVDQLEDLVLRGMENVKRFDSKVALDRIERIYQQVLNNEL
jgi:glycosyltransferase involved in cell wall biosynthesis